MSLESRTVGTLIRNDLRLLLRSPRTLAMSVLLPLLIWPLMFFLTSLADRRAEERSETRSYRYAVVGSEAQRVQEWIARLGEEGRIVPADTPPEGGEAAGAAESTGEQAPAPRPLRLESVPHGELGLEGSSTDQALAAALDREVVDFWIWAEPPGVLPPLEEPDASSSGEAGDDTPQTLAGEALEAGEPAEVRDEIERELGEEAGTGASADALAESQPAAPVVLRIGHRGDRDASESGSDRLIALLDDLRRELRLQQLADRGFQVDTDALLAADSNDVATAEQSSGAALGRFLTGILILLMLSGGSVVAMDTLAGEKERGTLETLLTTAASRLEIVTAKSLAILLVAVGIAALQVLNLWVWLELDVFDVPETFSIPVTPGLAALLLVLYLPLAALISSLLLIVSGYSRTYKEAQLLFFPLFLVSGLPALVTILPAVELRSALVLVPISNLALGVRELLSGRPDWPMLALAWLVNAVLAGVVAWFSVRALSSERLMSSTDTDEADLFGGPPLFSRHALRLYAVLWAVFLVWQLNASPDLDIRVILVVNMSIFVAAALFFIRRYRLPWKEALAWRAPHPATWLAVLIGAPAGLLAFAMIGRWTSFFLDVPEEALERFSQSLAPPDMSTATLLFFLAVLPGICEEIAFRGTLLHGLRRHFSPTATALLVGAVFGVFHVSLFRIPPTAALGVLLAFVTLWSGSIWPAMLWHALNNATALLLDRYGERLEELGVDGPAMQWAAVAVVSLTMAVIWWVRRPYPRPGAERPRPGEVESEAVAAA